MTPLLHARLQGVDDEAQHQTLIAAALADLVPRWIEHVRAWTPEQRSARSFDASAVLCYGSKCDATEDPETGYLLGRGRYGGSAHFALGIPAPEGEQGATLNAMAMGLALLAYHPGGIRFLGLHWEVTAPNMEHNSTTPR